MLVRCFKLMVLVRPPPTAHGYVSADAEVELNFPGIGSVAAGPWGRRVVVAAVALEFFGATIVVLVFMWNNLTFLLPQQSPLVTGLLSLLGYTPRR